MFRNQNFTANAGVKGNPSMCLENLRHKIPLSLLVGLACTSASSAFGQGFVAESQIGQVFFNDTDGWAVTFQSPSIDGPLPQSNGETAELVVAEFKKACLDSKLDLATINSVVSTGPLALVQNDFKIPFTGPAFAKPVSRWSGNGVSLLVTHSTIGFTKGSGFKIEGPQCTLVFGEPSFQSDSLEAEFTRVLGAAPNNAAKALKNGKPNKSYSPRWLWTMADGTQQQIGYTLLRMNGQSGRLQISLIPPKVPKAK
jgi:hypothetical protein